MTDIKNILVITAISGLVVYMAVRAEIALAIAIGAFLGLIGYVSTRAILNADLANWIMTPKGHTSSAKSLVQP